MEEDKIYLEKLIAAYNYYNVLIPALEKLISETRVGDMRNAEAIPDALTGIKQLSESLEDNPLFHAEIDKDLVAEYIMDIFMSFKEKDYEFLSETLSDYVLPMVMKWYEVLDEYITKNNVSL